MSTQTITITVLETATIFDGPETIYAMTWLPKASLMDGLTLLCWIK